MEFRPEDRISLVNARVVDVENGRYYPGEAGLVIQGGKIVAMPGLPGEPATVQVDAVIDLHGMAVVPGMFNTHCHLQFGDLGQPREAQIAGNLAACLDRGVTTVRDTLCWDLDQNRVFADRISRGELPGPRIYQAVHVAPIGDTYAPHQSLMNRMMFSMMKLAVVDYRDRRSGVVPFRQDASEQEVRDAVNRAIDERGATCIKSCDQREHFMSEKPGASVITGTQLQAAIDQADRRGVPTTTHNVTAAGFRQAVRAGSGSLAHLPLDADITDADAQLLLAARAFVEPTLTLGFYMSYSMKGSPVSGHPELQRLAAYRDRTIEACIAESWPPAMQQSHRTRHALLQGGEMKLYGFVDLSAPFRYYAPLMTTGAENLRRLVDAGAITRLGCGSDAGPANCSPAVINQELAMFDFTLNKDGKVRFTAADALAVATIQRARAMHVDGELGSIATGKTADLVLIDGDPLADLHLIGQPVQALFKDGKLMIDRCGLS